MPPAPKEAPKTFTDKDLLSNLLKSTKDCHFNLLEERYWKISTGSLLLDSVVGGVTPGLHRFVGQNSGGKTSEALEVLRNFFRQVPKSKGIYFNAEGRLSKEMKERSGHKFVTKPEDWDYGTIFILDTNIYEQVAQTIETLIKSEGDSFYGMILDSTDAMILKNDLAKTFEESNKVAGGAVIASNLMKRIAIPLSKRGHLAIFISQVRSDISLDPYAPKNVRQISATGGNALLHYANLIIQFEPRFNKDLILTKDGEQVSASNPPLGHYAKVIIKKSNNETNNYSVRYPVKYGAKGESSVWVGKEIVDSLLQWEDLEKAGAWFNFSKEICAKIPQLPQDGKKFQGMDAVFSFIEANPELRDILFNHLVNLVSGTQIQLVSDEAT